MTVPDSDLGNLLVADWAESFLFFPEGVQPVFAFEGRCHLNVETFFKVGLPVWVIRVGFILDFNMSLDGDTLGLEQSNRLNSSIVRKDFSLEHPVLSCDGLEVFLLNPFDGLLWMSPFSPLPERTKDRMVDLREGFRASHMSVIVRPSSNFRV